MKLTLSVFFAALLWALLAYAPNVKADAKAEVLAAFEQLVEASKRRDSERYFALLDPEKFVGLNSDGTNWTSFEQFAPLIEQGFTAIKKVESLTFPNVTVSIIDEYTAVLVNEFEQVSVLQNNTVFKYCGGGTQVWSKRTGTWKLVSISASNRTRDCAL